MQEHAILVAAGAKGGTNFILAFIGGAGVELRTNSRVREIQIDEATGLANGVLYHGRWASYRRAGVAMWLVMVPRNPSALVAFII